MLLSAIEDVPGVSVRSLYNRYPDLSIDVASEQAALQSADIIVWQAPFYWYGVPALFHLWFEKVLEHRFAYGHEGKAVSGKPLLWVATAGTPLSEYRPGGAHEHPFEAFTHSVEQTARFCGMRWQPPIIVYGSHDIAEADLATHARKYRERLEQLSRSLTEVARHDG